MIDNNTQPSNPVLTPEQTHAIEYSKSILLNLEGEISIAQKTLKQTKSESERAIKDKIYQEELLKEITDKINITSPILTQLELSISEKTGQLNNLLSTIQEETVIRETKSAEFVDREAKIAERETQLSNQGSAIEKDRIILDNDINEFYKKVERLKDIIRDF